MKRGGWDYPSRGQTSYRKASGFARSLLYDEIVARAEVVDDGLRRAAWATPAFLGRFMREVGRYVWSERSRYARWSNRVCTILLGCFVVYIVAQIIRSFFPTH